MGLRHLLCVVLVCVPTVAADGVSSVRLVFGSPAEAAAEITSVGEGEDAAHLRQSMDSDEDGVVTQQEVDHHEAQYREFLQSEQRRSSSEMVGATYLLDEQGPSTELDGFEFQGAAGEADSEDRVEMKIELTYTWNMTPGDLHTLLVHADGPGETVDPADITFEIEAPAGYHISATGAPDAQFSSDRRTVTTTLLLQADQDFFVTFQRGEADIPGVGAMAACVVVAAVAFYARRRGA